MKNIISKITLPEYPFLLRQISKPPPFLYIQGELPPENYIYLCDIGAREHSPYGKDACEDLIRGLARYPIAIVSGLALGIDSIAHETALEVNLPTIAFPGSGLDDNVLYPPSKRSLAENILTAGGALLSPFKMDQIATRWTFPERNRLMAGISQALLIVEGKKGSGTLLTASHALGFNRDLMIVPGPIFSDLSYGPHLLMRDGAHPVTNSREILNILGFEDNEMDVQQNMLTDIYSPTEKRILEQITISIPRDDLVRNIGMSMTEANALISGLELKGIISDENGIVRLIRTKNYPP